MTLSAHDAERILDLAVEARGEVRGHRDGSAAFDALTRFVHGLAYPHLAHDETTPPGGEPGEAVR